MALVKFEKFKGSVITEEVIGNLVNLGLIAYARSFGYTMNITPVMEKTPKGYIEDAPNKHRVEFVRDVQITNGGSEDAIINRESYDDFKFPHTFKYKSGHQRKVWVDEETNTTWYKHTYYVEINRLGDQSNSDYAMAITEHIFESFKLEV